MFMTHHRGGAWRAVLGFPPVTLPGLQEFSKSLFGVSFPKAAGLTIKDPKPSPREKTEKLPVLHLQGGLL